MPPFGTTDISKLHRKKLDFLPRFHIRHSVLQTSASCTSLKTSLPVSWVPPFGTTDISKLHRIMSSFRLILLLPAIRYYRHQQVALALFVYLADIHTAIRYYRHQQVAPDSLDSYISSVDPPFGTTDISKLHSLVFIFFDYREVPPFGTTDISKLHDLNEVSIVLLANPPFGTTDISKLHLQNMLKVTKTYSAIRYYRHQQVAHARLSVCRGHINAAIRYYRHQQVAPLK